MRRFRLITVAVLGALGVWVPGVLAAPVILKTAITWTDRHGRVGSGDFQGTADGEVLRGIVMSGNDELKVRGTIAQNGAVSGTLTAPNGNAIGSFSATLTSDGRLEGAYVPVGGNGGHWSARADALPVPQPRRLGR